MVYYFLILMATILFTSQLFFNKKYLLKAGDSLYSAIIFSMGTNATICVIMLFFNKGRIEFSVFSFIIAILNALVNISFTYCTVKALSGTNLSVYSLFSVIGGMIFPFLSGILIWGEALTKWKAICCVLIITALLLNSSKGNKKSDSKYYIFVFTLNGLAGVLQKWHQSMTSVNISSTGYLMLYSFTVVVISAVILLFVKDRKITAEKGIAGYMAGFGAVNGMGTLFVLISLVHLPASVQYPIVTGGVMIASTILSFILKENIKKKSIAAVALSFVGMLLLIL